MLAEDEVLTMDGEITVADKEGCRWCDGAAKLECNSLELFCAKDNELLLSKTNKS